MLSSIIGVSVQPNKAIVGDNAFAHEAGIHQDGVLKAAITYEIMTPQSIGRPSNELVLGKHSGRHAFRDRLARAGLRARGRGVPARLPALQGSRGQEEDDLQRGPRGDRRRLGDAHRRALRAGGSLDPERHLRRADRHRGAAGRRRSRRKTTAPGIGPGGRGLQGDRGAHGDEERARALSGERHHRRHGRARRGVGHRERGRAHASSATAPTRTSSWPARRPTSTRSTSSRGTSGSTACRSPKESRWRRRVFASA